ncbi:hypothetical protein VCHA53O466_50006 [Vibrio chagasii]|nr:hypothetical protein VCHA53O466_50006 [Vibrio chagasii]
MSILRNNTLIEASLSTTAGIYDQAIKINRLTVNYIGIRSIKS